MTRETLIEQCTAAYRQTVRGQIRSSEAWHDLDPDDRLEAHDRTATARTLEAALDPEGLSPTARAVLDRITG